MNGKESVYRSWRPDKIPSRFLSTKIFGISNDYWQSQISKTYAVKNKLAILTLTVNMGVYKALTKAASKEGSEEAKKNGINKKNKQRVLILSSRGVTYR